ncbi:MULTISPECIES: terminase small subunit [unclassified Peribacillus]|uniref:terminase small subunit n=1 Tax=unclassified Peribacillus TaxID=2675266 RepID=UPI0036706B0C
MSNVGRPLKFQSVEDLQQKIDAYFDSCFEESWYRVDGEWKPELDRYGEVVTRRIKPFTISGLAVFLETTRRTLLDYEQRNDEYSHTIRAAKNKIESFAEESLWQPKIATGVMFNLKNNFSWEDKQNVHSTGETTHNIKTQTDLSKLSVEELKELETILSKTSDTE